MFVVFDGNLKIVVGCEFNGFLNVVDFFYLDFQYWYLVLMIFVVYWCIYGISFLIFVFLIFLLYVFSVVCM